MAEEALREEQARSEEAARMASVVEAHTRSERHGGEGRPKKRLASQVDDDNDNEAEGAGKASGQRDSNSGEGSGADEMSGDGGEMEEGEDEEEEEDEKTEDVIVPAFQSDHKTRPLFEESLREYMRRSRQSPQMPGVVFLVESEAGTASIYDYIRQHSNHHVTMDDVRNLVARVRQSGEFGNNASFGVESFISKQQIKELKATPCWMWKALEKLKQEKATMHDRQPISETIAVDGNDSDDVPVVVNQKIGETPRELLEAMKWIWNLGKMCSEGGKCITLLFSDVKQIVFNRSEVGSFWSAWLIAVPGQAIQESGPVVIGRLRGPWIVGGQYKFPLGIGNREDSPRKPQLIILLEGKSRSLTKTTQHYLPIPLAARRTGSGAASCTGS
ncbi:unnamed protein product [Phytophthora fragariaefolia]|uniref:Unnamed protein product n=1 Tax=Phytophthora fragariaefolia TaxID=1490495 RepID=A0A9W6TWD2_9STRA|nr:unnamed protein product [Phytophthora fragariaefolia]